MLSCMLLYSCLMAYRQELQLDRFAIAGNVFPTDFQNFWHYIYLRKCWFLCVVIIIFSLL